jgi:hypothetical protein
MTTVLWGGPAACPSCIHPRLNLPYQKTYQLALFQLHQEKLEIEKTLHNLIKDFHQAFLLIPIN